ncbi:alpha/beta hydrolase fold domain-containing protein [Sphingomonas sp. ZB1N12]|uniref:alpha/beta hydrolase fold domain-containing protein n=1 Tax=Sphingomonas arabinosi TaxID=3096160 RepID=UPI003FA756C7
MLLVQSLIKLGKPMANAPEDRLAYDALLSGIPAAQGVDYTPDTVGGVSGWWCLPKRHGDHVLLHFHGGAYVMGSAWAYRNFVGQIARRVGARAFIPDYALAPEQPFPHAFDDASAVYRALAKGSEAIGIVGDSAGGGLALGLLRLVAHDPVMSLGRQPRIGVESRTPL